MTKERNETSEIRCECGALVAKIERGALVVEVRHHGEKHKTVVSVDWLLRLLEQADKSVASPTANAR